MKKVYLKIHILLLALILTGSLKAQEIYNYIDYSFYETMNDYYEWNQLSMPLGTNEQTIYIEILNYGYSCNPIKDFIENSMVFYSNDGILTNFATYRIIEGEEDYAIM